MAEQQEQPRYWVSVCESEQSPGDFLITFVPRGLQQERGLGGSPRRVPRYIASVRVDGDNPTVDWTGTPDAPGSARQELEQLARDQMNTRRTWIDRVEHLVEQVEIWSKDLGWATRRIEKRLDDSYIGKHRVPGLLLQEGTSRILLEPVGRSASGTAGVVDLYLMPAYDDIARLSYDDNHWNVHYLFPGTAAVTAPEASPQPLSKETLQAVLAQMMQHAASA